MTWIIFRKCQPGLSYRHNRSPMPIRRTPHECLSKTQADACFLAFLSCCRIMGSPGCTAVAFFSLVRNRLATGPVGCRPWARTDFWLCPGADCRLYPRPATLENTRAAVWPLAGCPVQLAAGSGVAAQSATQPGLCPAAGLAGSAALSGCQKMAQQNCRTADPGSVPAGAGLCPDGLDTCGADQKKPDGSRHSGPDVADDVYGGPNHRAGGGWHPGETGHPPGSQGSASD